ncbi:PEP-CTERM putative exosortase interaction domain-containing protein [Leptolyngbyaceae cyanobacterium JSC-12]|nr:PEP-CTERM putative exosortase interaction domain-containing protein [Leptolyngbyaceae cyanobacterium JSC-12]
MRVFTHIYVHSMKLHLKVSLALSVFTLLGSTAAEAEAALLIGNTRSDSIVIFDEISGTILGDFTTPGANGLRDPDAITIGPDGAVYVSVGGNSGLNLFDPAYPQDSAVLRFNLQGEFLGVAASGNGLTRPYGNAFGPDGNLYVSSFRTNQILRFDSKTGAFIDIFASDNNGGFGSTNGLNGPNGLLFGPDGSLYVTTQGSANDANGNLVFPFASQVLRYTPEQVLGVVSTTTPTVFIDQPTPLPGSGFVSLLGLALAPDLHSLYVSDFANGIRQYDLAGQLLSVLSTNYTGTIPSNNFIGSLAFGADTSNLFAVGFDFTNNNLGSVLTFPGAEGDDVQFTGSLFTSSQLVRPIGVAAVPVAAVPEPTTIAGVAIALGGFAVSRRRKRQ